MATYDLREAVNISAMELASSEDEFLHAGVSKQECIDTKVPRVKESPAHFECKYLSTHRLAGNSNHGYVDVVYGQVMRIHVNDQYIDANGKMDIKNIRPLARLGTMTIHQLQMYLKCVYLELRQKHLMVLRESLHDTRSLYRFYK